MSVITRDIVMSLVIGGHMATDIDMASNALVLLGDSPISSFDDPGAGAQTASNLYTETYRSVLASHPWPVALKEQHLSRLSQQPDVETFYTYAFQLPADLIRIWKMMSHSRYDVIGSLVYSNEPALLCRYIYQVDEADLPPHMVKAVEYKLAAEFAIPVTEDENKAQIYERKFQMQVAQAQTIESQGHPQHSIIDSPFTDVRLTGSSYGLGY